MESEKVKEIKKVLNTWKIVFHGITNADILTYINELESENERLSFYKTVFDKGVCTKLVNMQETIDKQEDRIAELEKDCTDIANHYQEMGKFYYEETKKNQQLENTIKNNLQYTKGYGDGVKATVEVAYPKKLNEFAERLKEKFEHCVGDIYHADTIDERIDETLKEFIN